MKNVIPPIIQEVSNLKNPKGPTEGIKGYSSARVRILLNKIVSKLPPNEAYLEVGCRLGSTMIPALFGHRSAIAYGCDDFSMKNNNGVIQKALSANMIRYEPQLPKIRIFSKDCFELCREPHPFDAPIGVYFYDADHSEEAQCKAIVDFKRFFAPEVVAVIDDWNRPRVRAGTWKGIGLIYPKKVESWELLTANNNGDKDGFWCGLGIFHITL